MKLEKNVGNLDRYIRIVLSVFFVASMFYFQSPLSIVLVFIGLVLLVTAFTHSCALYSLLKFNTLAKEDSDQSFDKTSLPSKQSQQKKSVRKKKLK